MSATDFRPSGGRGGEAPDPARPDARHGALADYKVRGCRCDPCKAAHRDYERTRSRKIAYGQWEPYIDAQPTRDHVKQLQAAGMGWKRVARSAGLSESVVWKLLYGDQQRNLAPSKRIRRATAEKLLAVHVDLAGGVAVEAVGTRRRLQALIAIGWSGSELGRRLGITPANFWTMLKANRAVSVSTASRVRALYDEMWRAGPTEDARVERYAASRARNLAAGNGWLPPLAWDDDTIDDPSAVVVLKDSTDSVDDVAVERVLDFHQPLPTLNPAEKRAAFASMLEQGRTVTQASTRLRLSGSKAREWAKLVVENASELSVARERIRGGAEQGCSPTRLLTESPATTGAAMPIVAPESDACQRVAI